MNQNTQKFIENIITEASLDSRILDGIVDIHNTEHIVIIAEKMHDAGIEEQAVDQFVEQFMEEGKYPERQAYNKDGWLVTFPSKEYRDAAIKKRTHFTSDPTHGKGGMNLYYKKKGKQKRQTQQAPTVTEPKEPSAKPQPNAKVYPATKTATADKSQQTYKTTTDKEDGISSTESPEQEFERLSAEEEDGVEEKPKTDTVQKPIQKVAPAAPEKQDAPSIDVPVVTTPPEEFAKVSKRFASQKQWTPTEYGEYRDSEGNPVAVVGLSGEVVPIRSNDREEYKIFAEKSKA